MLDPLRPLLPYTLNCNPNKLAICLKWHIIISPFFQHPLLFIVEVWRTSNEPPNETEPFSLHNPKPFSVLEAL